MEADSKKERLFVVLAGRRILSNIKKAS